MERAGILHVDANAPLLPKSEDSVKRAIGISEGMYNLFGKHYENKLAAQKAQLGEETLPGQISATNAKNNADTVYYPQQQEAKLQHERAQVKEVMARTGLSYAQAKVAMAHLPLLAAQTAKEQRSERGEGGKQAQLWQAYQNAPAGSEQKRYFGALLNKETAGHMMNFGGGQVPGNPSGGAVPQLGGGQVPSGAPMESGVPFALQPFAKDEKFGSKRSGAGGTYTDPATGQTISTPTNSTTTRNQAAIQALQRVTPLIKDLSKNMSQFQTASQKGQLGLERVGNLLGGNYDLPNQKAEALQDLALAPESLLKAYQLNVTDKSLSTMENAIKPIVGETQKGYQDRLAKTLVTLKENEEAAKKVQAEGIDVTQPGAQPYSQGGGGGFGAYGYEEPRQQVAQGFQGNPNVPQENPNAAQEANLTPGQAKQEQEIYYNEMAAQAIKAGADPEKVKQRMAELKAKGMG